MHEESSQEIQENRCIGRENKTDLQRRNDLQDLCRGILYYVLKSSYNNIHNIWTVPTVYDSSSRWVYHLSFKWLWCLSADNVERLRFLNCFGLQWNAWWKLRYSEGLSSEILYKLEEWLRLASGENWIRNDSVWFL